MMKPKIFQRLTAIMLAGISVATPAFANNISFSETPVTTICNMEIDYAREDFSLLANPAIFDKDFTPAAYNALRQIYLDRADIVTGVIAYPNMPYIWYNPYYYYPHYFSLRIDGSRGYGETLPTDVVVYSIMERLGEERSPYWFKFFSEPYLDRFMGYRTIGVRTKSETEDARVKEVHKKMYAFTNRLTDLSDKEKLYKILIYVGEHIKPVYVVDYLNATNFYDAYLHNKKEDGSCYTYSANIKIVCDIAEIPCVVVNGEVSQFGIAHSWNEIYIDEMWHKVDGAAFYTGYADKGSYEQVLVRAWPWDSPEHSPYIMWSKNDKAPEITRYIKEIMVPNSTSIK